MTEVGSEVAVTVTVIVLVVVATTVEVSELGMELDEDSTVSSVDSKLDCRTSSSLWKTMETVCTAPEVVSLRRLEGEALSVE